MDRRTFIKGATVGLAGVGVMATPVAASHITEPTRPVYAIDTDIYRYPDITTKIPNDGTGVVTWQGAGIRFETQVTPHPVWPDRHAPTEHFRVDIEYWVPDPDGFPRLVRDWYGMWNHQNTVPHLSGPPGSQEMEIYQLTQTRGDLVKGVPHVNWFKKRKWTVMVRGNESGVVLSQDIPFTVDVP